MKAKTALLLMISLLQPMTIISVKANEIEGSVSSEFLEFLADMEEVTGDGFTHWLDSENEQELNKAQQVITDQSTENQ